ncbi:MAG: PAS domain S-box protein [Rhodospirillales bacterium]|nr:PAS domain S-box protein [Rhodospirillales bacterium]
MMFFPGQNTGRHDPPAGRFPFLAQGGAMGDRISHFDWSCTSLGTIEGWAPVFCAHVSTMLSAPEPLMIFTGPDGVLLFNDASMPFTAARCPAALGKTIGQIWPQISDAMSRLLLADQGGYAPVILALEGSSDEPGFTLLCSPLMNETGKRIGVLAKAEWRDEGWDGALTAGQNQLVALREVARTMPRQIWTANAQGRVDWMNPHLQACLGPASEGEGWASLVHAQDRPLIARRWAEAVASGGLYDAECRLQTASGAYVWHLVYATPFRNNAGTVEGWVGSNHNIQERKDAEAEAGRARNRVWQLSRTYMLIFDQEGVIRHSNLAIELGTGWRQEDIAGQNLLNFVHPEDAETTLMALARVAAGEIVQGFECRCLMQNGDYRVIEWDVAPDGELNHAFGQDMTEKRGAMRALQRMWDLSPVLKIVLRPGGEVVTVNPAWTKALGWSEQASRARRMADFIAPDERERLRAQFNDFSPAALSSEFVVTMLTEQGDYRQIAWTRVAEGGLLYGFGRDVTAERRAAAAAASASAERERIWVSSNDLLAIASGDGVLRSVNPAWGRLLGYAESEILGLRLLNLVMPEDRPEAERAIRELAVGRTIRDIECRMNDRQGRLCLISWSADSLGDSFYFVGRDVSAQRDAEEQLRQAQKMEAVGQLTGGIAHDFNNLLQGITGSLELMSKRVQRGETQGLERFVTMAMNAAERAAALTHRLLAFSRRQPLDPKPVEANPLILSMEMLLRRTLGEGVDLQLDLQDELWLTLCDPNQLENALLNLAINARDAMPGGGKLIIQTFNAELEGTIGPRRSEVLPGPYVCIAVTDSGVGMDAVTIAKVFEPFFTTKPLGQGTGLGLSMIYGFTRQSNGHVRIESEPGLGATVRLYLPRYEGAAAILPPCLEEVDMPAAALGDTVLVVEDEPVVRGLIVEVLAGLGYAALEAQDGPGGLEILQSRQKIDLLITDIGLPGLNGRQIADAARLLRPKLKILFMTGYAENAGMGNGGLEPGMEIMAKPFAMDALAARVRGMIAPDG